MIEAHALSRRYGSFRAVEEVSLEVPAGTVLALLGPNGAGKTTTVRMLAGLLAPSAGRASVAGFDVVRDAAQVRARVGLVTDVPGLYERMTLPDYLDFFGALYGMPRERRAKRIDELLDFFEMGEHRDERMGGFSKGMKQKVALARALLHEPAALFLDEPTSGLDPLSARAVRTLIVDLKQSNRGIILCTHDLDEAERLADQIAIMRGGRIVAHGTAATLRRRASPETLVRIELARIELARPAAGEADSLLAELRRLDGVLDPRAEGIRSPEGPAYGTDGASGRSPDAPTAGMPLARLQYRTTDPEAVNPRVLARLIELGAAVVSATNLTRTLEDVYADTMGLSRGGDIALGPAAASVNGLADGHIDGHTGGQTGAAINGRRADDGGKATETVRSQDRTPAIHDRESNTHRERAPLDGS